MENVVAGAETRPVHAVGDPRYINARLRTIYLRTPFRPLRSTRKWLPLRVSHREARMLNRSLARSRRVALALGTVVALLPGGHLAAQARPYPGPDIQVVY